jgi:redox-sensitive bicupin YhaK (pirin superfamily)
MSVVDLVLEAHARDLGGFAVRRTLPSMKRRSVGPFVFFDHFGPTSFAPGEAGLDVRPHPHIGLATITYLFEGEVMHRDSLGSEQRILPGDVNWMIAGQGIVHSERTPPEVRARGARIHGLQTWIALPDGEEEAAPRFEHHDKTTLPVVEREGVVLRIVAGTAYGAAAGASVLSPTLYAHARMDRGATLEVDDGHEQRAAYVVTGAVTVEGRPFEPGAMLVLARGARVAIEASAAADVVLIGGAPVGERHIEWNFVSSSMARIEQAKADWGEGRFPKVPTDADEFIPLPGG